MYPPYRGGMGTVVEHDARCLQRLEGIDVHVFTPYRKMMCQNSDGDVQVHRLATWCAWGNAAIMKRLFFDLKTFDIIHLHYPFFGSDIVAVLASVFWRIPLVLTYHMRPRASGALGWIFRLYRWIFQGMIFACTRVLLVSSREYAHANGVHHRNLIEMPFGVDVERFFPGDQVMARRHLALPENVFTVLFVGGLDRAHYFKGLSVLLDACRLLKESWQLLVVGDGDCRGDFEAQVRQLGISAQVYFLGSVSQEDLPVVYRASDVHVLPSIDRSEAFGLVTLEAMASGVPSIVSDLPGMRTLIVPNETGLLVPSNDREKLAGALQYFCQRSDVVRGYGMRARDRACRLYHEHLLTEKLFSIYRHLFPIV